MENELCLGSKTWVLLLIMGDMTIYVYKNRGFCVASGDFAFFVLGL